MDGQTPNSAQRRQRLASEAEGVDIQQVRAVDLGCGMAGQGQRQFILGDAPAIIRDADQRFAPVGDINRNPARACVDGVFHQLFNRRGRAFNHLARRDTVDGSIV